MRNRFDQLGKALGVEVLSGLGATKAHEALNAETVYPDLVHEPAPGIDPDHEVTRRRLGLLGELTRTPCLLELFSEPPRRDSLRICLAKHLTYLHKREREMRTERGEAPEADPRPVWSWLISAGVPRGLLAALAFRPAPDIARGVYLLRGDLEQLGVNVGLVVASELAATRATLLVRLMAGGPRLPAAVRELAAPPDDAYERIVADPVLLHFQHKLEQDSTRALVPEEQEFIMVMHKSWKEARAEGRAEGRAEERADIVRRMLVLKFGELPPSVEQRLTAATPEELDRLLERILFADSLEALFV